MSSSSLILYKVHSFRYLSLKKLYFFLISHVYISLRNETLFSYNRVLVVSVKLHKNNI